MVKQQHLIVHHFVPIRLKCAPQENIFSMSSRFVTDGSLFPWVSMLCIVYVRITTKAYNKWDVALCPGIKGAESITV